MEENSMENKQHYESLDMEIVVFDTEDIITDSNGTPIENP